MVVEGFMDTRTLISIIYWWKMDLIATVIRRLIECLRKALWEARVMESILET